MPIRWDSVLVRDLARALDSELTGARLRAIRMDARTRDVALFFRDRTVLWALHPERSGVWIRDAVDPQPADLRLRARVRSVRSVPDERILIFELQSPRSGRGPWTLIVEVLGNQMNAIVAEGVERTARHVLRTRAGRRTLRVGQPWYPPPPTDRRWVDGVVTEQEWTELLGPVPPPDRARVLVRSVAWTSPMNARACLADGPDAELLAGLETWRSLASGTNPLAPTILDTDRGPQPYSCPLPGFTGQPSDDLLSAIADSAGSDRAATSEGALAIGPELLERLEDAIAHAERRVVRLTAELDGQPAPARLRALGDLLLARYGEIPSGQTTVEVRDFEGSTVVLELDPALPPHENAARYYDRAGRSERAAERLPQLIEATRAEAASLAALLDRAHRGDVEVTEIQSVLPAAPARQKRGVQTPAPPYRVFRSSGGLEIRVGRGARHNDDLTFRHSAPNDVWLHARHTAGAHVILRWSGEGAPPARDLEEAAGLAALYSKARTSATVPVDWTRRKYVRKPRKSPPGSVVPDRVQTVFASPDESLVERLSTDDPGGTA